jgi:hypothetical protein
MPFQSSSDDPSAMCRSASADRLQDTVMQTSRGSFAESMLSVRKARSQWRAQDLRHAPFDAVGS